MITEPPTGFRRQKSIWNHTTFWQGLPGRLGSILFGILMAWLLLEIGVRLFYPYLPYMMQAPLRYVKQTPWGEQRLLPPPAWQGDPNFQMVMTPGLVDSQQYPNPYVSLHLTTLNWLDPASHVGFRVPSPDWAPRWPVDAVIVGDSMALCFTEYPDCWVSRLESIYGRSVVNLAQGATGSISHANILRTFGLPFEPRVVIWQWYGNDFNEDYGFVHGAEPPGRPVGAQSPGRIESWLQANSVAYWLSQTLTATHFNQAGYEEQVDPFYVNQEGVSLYFGRPYTLVAADLSLPRNQEGVAYTREALDQTRALLAGRGKPILLVILLIPFKEEVYAGLTAPHLGEQRLTELSRGRAEMNAYCREHSLPCLDVTADLMRAASAGQQLYFTRDTHLNETGNALVARLVAEYLDREGLLP